jgi:hypothetical protein
LVSQLLTRSVTAFCARSHKDLRNKKLVLHIVSIVTTRKETDVEHQLWKAILILLKQASKLRRCTRERYGADDIVQVWLWAVLHGRPVSWACDLRNWPLHERRRKLPSSSTMSRRLRSAEVQQMLQEIERSELAPRGNKPLYWMIDGKPLPIGGCSKDRQAGYGRAAGCKAKGYKLHAVVGSDGSIAAWRVAPMQKDERAMGRRMLKQAAVQGYLLADANFDSNQLHDVCLERGVQLVAPPRYGFGRRRGHRRQSPARLRSLELLSNPQSSFGRALHQERNAIERYFGYLSTWSAGLQALPAWVRGHRRVHRWVQGKLIFTALRRRCQKTTYVTR